MKKLGLVLVVALGSAYAGQIVVSGDGNFANALNGSGAIALDGDNQQFFTNVLGAGTNVRVQSTTGLSSPSLAVADSAVNSFYNSLGGVTSSFLAAGFGAADLAGVDLFVVVIPDAGYGAGELAALSALLSSGGTVFLLGDNSNFPTQNGFLNSAISALGGTIQIVNGTVSGATPVAHPLTAGVGPLSYVAGSTLTGGTTLALSGGSAVLAVETVGDSPVPEPSTLGMTCGVLALVVLRRKLRGRTSLC